MKQSYKFAAGVVASLGLGIAVATAYANPGQMGGGMGPQMHMKGGMGPGAMKGGPAGPAAAQELMTPEERTALQEKMRNAKTPEERQQIATATRTEMEKRAKAGVDTCHAVEYRARIHFRHGPASCTEAGLG